ncbi:MAG: glucuronate isomerase, partial [Oscillospiraceae bacterium]|nr:glucuronate isomerase [Oscillospiraceae bacterium]
DRFARYGCVSADITDLKIAGSLAPELARRGWTMLLHLGPLRNVNSAAFSQIGINAGFDAMGGGVDISELATFLDGLNSAGNLPRSIIFSINPNDDPILNALCGAFPQVFQGPAWWFNDTFDGIRAQLRSYAAVNAIGTHPGMVTDSRSFLSYSRHEYFRRIFCDFLAEAAIRGKAGFDTLGAIVRRVCYENAKQIVNRKAS